MTRQALITQLMEIATEAGKSDDRQVKAAGGIISSLIGTLYTSSTFDMLKSIMPFVRGQQELCEANIREGS